MALLIGARRHAADGDLQLCAHGQSSQKRCGAQVGAGSVGAAQPGGTGQTCHSVSFKSMNEGLQRDG